MSAYLYLVFALCTVASWGVYGVFLHKGQIGMGAGDENARYKAFLIVGIAYFVVAILGPAILLLVKAGPESLTAMTRKGVYWSFLAGAVGAIGAFCVLLAFGAAPKPTVAYVPVVMSIIFAGAPIVNALVSMAGHPPAGGLKGIPPLFMVGILLAAAGGALVTIYKPKPAGAGHKPDAPPVQATTPAPDAPGGSAADGP